MTRLAISAILFYQRHLSAHTGATCRYEPSCSAYALTSYRRFGFLWGSFLTTYRLARCTPWGGHGADPVPARRDGRPDVVA